MVKYCKKDVILLEKVFSHIRTHIEPKTHYGVVFGQERGSCPECGADHTNLTVATRRATATGLRKVVYQCKVCNKFHTKTDK